MKCELCGGLARMHCESDQANLCWDCDVKVHGANFLVAKHSRTLLCHVCQNPTPWLASESSEDEYEEEDDEKEEEGEEEEDEVEDGENQVVPWSRDSSSFSISKPVASLDSLSSNEGGGGGGGLKRMRDNLSFYSNVC
ncbi:hypothetical protein CRYUN_Cryun11dG0029000 [Craigia yunnanensis]